VTRFKIILCGALVVAGMTSSLVIQYQAQVKLREKDRVLRQQDRRLFELVAESQRLSNLVIHADSSPAHNRPAAEDRTAELVKLRAEAETLRKQVDELGKQRTQSRPPHPSHRLLWPGPNIHSVAGVSVVSDADSEEYAKQLAQMASENRKLADARNLSRGVRWYVPAHQGELPLTFDQAAPYFYADQEPPRTSEFEMVFQGSRNELTNVPEGAVILIRERQAWPTPRGRWARIYVMVSGEVSVVEANDNFQSWEAEHIIPPPSAGQQ